MSVFEKKLCNQTIDVFFQFCSCSVVHEKREKINKNTTE